MIDNKHIGFINGMKVFESVHVTEEYQDWSKVRSPSRAKRRLKYGHKQNVYTRRKPIEGGYVLNNNLFIHPETAIKMRLVTNEEL